MLLLLSESCRNLSHHWCRWWGSNPHDVSIKGFDPSHRLVPTMRFELIYLSVLVLEASASAYSATSGYSHHRVQLSETPWWPYRYLCREILLRRVRTALYNSREVYINPITNAGVLTGYRHTAVQLVIGLDIIGPRRRRSFHWHLNSAYV